MNAGRLSKRIPVVAAVCLLAVLAAPGLACFSPADRYAVEILLNKPGLSYNLSRLPQLAETVRTSSGAYVYRSRHDDRLLVVISEQRLSLAGVEPAREGPVASFEAPSGMNPGELVDAVGRVLAGGPQGWKVSEYLFPGGLEGFIFTRDVGDSVVRVYVGAASGRVRVGLSVACEPCEGELEPGLASAIESEVEDLLTELGLSEFRDLIGPLEVERSLVRGGGWPERYLAVRIQVPIVQRTETVTVFECHLPRGEVSPSELNPEAAEGLGWIVAEEEEGGGLRFTMERLIYGASVRIAGSVDAGGVLRLVVRVEGVHELEEGVLREIRSALSAAGLAGLGVDAESFERFEESVGSNVAPAFNVSETEVREALRFELEFLQSQGVVSGLTEGDISKIAARAELGDSGWNERLVWWEGRWVPYSETGLPLVKCSQPVPEFLSPETLDTLEVGELGLGTSLGQGTVHDPLALCGTSELPPGNQVEDWSEVLLVAALSAAALALLAAKGWAGWLR